MSQNDADKAMNEIQPVLSIHAETETREELKDIEVDPDSVELDEELDATEETEDDEEFEDGDEDELDDDSELVEDDDNE